MKPRNQPSGRVYKKPISKIPRDPKDYYIRTPADPRGRRPSLRAMAKLYGCSRNTLMDRKRREDWEGQRNQFWDMAKPVIDHKAAETLADMEARHIREAKVLQQQGLAALKNNPINKQADAIKAVESGIKLERLIKGKSTENEDTTITLKWEGE